MFLAIMDLFPLNRSGGLGSNVDQHAVDARNLMGDAVGDLADQSPVEGLDSGSHGVDGVDRAVSL